MPAGVVIRVRRPPIAITVLLAFLTALFAPVRTSWACPDGTPCVPEQGQGFVCADGQCRSHSSCCEVAKPNACEHEALPGLGASAPAGTVVTAPDHCRFSVDSHPHLTSLLQQARTVLLAFVALPAAPAAPISLCAARPVWRRADTLGYRPPPSFTTGPSRAPPAA
jgi:hypothetical protein